MDPARIAADFDEDPEDLNVDGQGRDLKGKGGDTSQRPSRLSGNRAGPFDRLPSGSAGGAFVDSCGCVPAHSVEGWILIVTNVHPEAQEEDVRDLFADYGQLKNLRMDINHRTCASIGYALVEFVSKDAALAALQGLNGTVFQGQALGVSFAFVDGPIPGYGATGTADAGADESSTKRAR
jgi:RNA-binding protein 8A